VVLAAEPVVLAEERVERALVLDQAAAARAPERAAAAIRRQRRVVKARRAAPDRPIQAQR